MDGHKKCTLFTLGNGIDIRHKSNLFQKFRKIGLIVLFLVRSHLGNQFLDILYTVLSLFLGLDLHLIDIVGNIKNLFK